jgi:DNA-binding CsgD family transcriptional regulator
VLPPPQRRALRAALLLEEAEASPRAITAGCLTLLRFVSRDRPVLLAIDDAQWLDAETLQVLDYVTRRLGGEPVGFVATYRDGEDTRDPLPPSYAASAADVTTLDLVPMSIGALHHLLVVRLGGPFPRPIVRRIHELSVGNPFVALELARSLPASPQRGFPAESIPAPGSVRDLILGRLADVPLEVQECLRLVAVAGDLPLGQLVQASGPDQRVTSSLDALVEAGFVEVPDGRVRFVHPLYGSTVYEDIPPFRRRELHRTLGRVATDPERRARHLGLATEEADADVAEELERASRFAMRRGAPASAADLAESAAALTPQGEGDRWRHRLLLAADGHMAAGNPTRARSILINLVDRLSPGAPRAHVLWRLADISGDDVHAQRTHCEQALQEAGGDAALEALIHLEFATLSWLGGDFGAAATHARQAVSLCEQTGDRRNLAIALAEVAHAMTNLDGQIPEPEMRRAMELEKDVPAFPPFLRPSYRYGVLLARLGDLDRGRELITAELSRCRTSGAEGALPGILVYLTDLERRAGRWDVAAMHLAEAMTLARQASIEQEQQAVRVRVAVEAAHLGDADRCRRVAAEVLAVAGPAGWRLIELQVRGALGLLELSLADPAAAHAHLAPATATLIEMGVAELSQYGVVENDIEALVALGKHADADRLIEHLHARGRKAGLPRLLALAARGRAMLQTAHGDLTEARTCIDTALEQHDRFVDPFEHARTLLVAGGIARRARQKRAAREPLDRAMASFEQLGARRWAERTHQELDRIGGRPPPSGELTPMELQVAELVTAGRSNSEVAAALHVTRKTVEKHLSRVYAKLGVHSRVELTRLKAQLPPRG